MLCLDRPPFVSGTALAAVERPTPFSGSHYPRFRSLITAPTRLTHVYDRGQTVGSDLVSGGRGPVEALSLAGPPVVSRCYS